MRLFDRVKSVSSTVTLENKRGLHARASHKFMECVSQYNSLVVVQSHNDVCEDAVEAASVMELLLLGAACGEDITITATGEDAKLVVAALINLVKRKFDEDE